jgi:general nucleoside transport system permease protein
MKPIKKALTPIANAYKWVMGKFAKFASKESGGTILSSVFSVIAGLLFGLILMLIFSPKDALRGLEIIITGAFQNGNTSFGNWFYMAGPIIITGLSVGFAFKTGLFNIGATGQFTMGAFTAVYIAIVWTWLPGGLHWIVAVIGAIVAGAVWGFIPGLLKAIFNVHEVVSTIMLNYVALYFVRWGIKLPQVFDGLSKTKVIPADAVIPKMGLQWLFPDSSVTGGIFLAILAFVIIYIVLEKTTFGYQLKAVGFNKDAAKYAGINEKKGIIYSMVIAGALAGLAGAVAYLTGAGKHLVTGDGLLSEGFDGIAVALLGNSSPIGVLIAGFFFGYLKNAGFYLQLLELNKELIQIIIASIIYFSALALLFRNLVKSIFKRHVVPLDGGDE